MKFILLFISIMFSLPSIAQIENKESLPSTPEELEKEYNRNIKKSIINGVYIPYDIEDAMKELEKKSPPKSLEKFKKAPEDIVAKKLHFGLGRWMVYNWNFYYGSRLERYLKNLGIEHPDDMADFLIICFHRHLNGKDLGIKELAEKFHKKRLEIIEKKRQVIDTIKVKK